MEQVVYAFTSSSVLSDRRLQFQGLINSSLGHRQDLEVQEVLEEKVRILKWVEMAGLSLKLVVGVKTLRLEVVEDLSPELVVEAVFPKLVEAVGLIPMSEEAEVILMMAVEGVWILKLVEVTGIQALEVAEDLTLKLEVGAKTPRLEVVEDLSPELVVEGVIPKLVEAEGLIPMLEEVEVILMLAVEGAWIPKLAVRVM
jgi:hypothetical protein